MPGGYAGCSCWIGVLASSLPSVFQGHHQFGSPWAVGPLMYPQLWNLQEPGGVSGDYARLVFPDLICVGPKRQELFVPSAVVPTRHLGPVRVPGRKRVDKTCQAGAGAAESPGGLDSVSASLGSWTTPPPRPCYALRCLFTWVSTALLSPPTPGPLGGTLSTPVQPHDSRGLC